MSIGHVEPLTTDRVPLDETFVFRIAIDLDVLIPGNGLAAEECPTASTREDVIVEQELNVALHSFPVQNVTL